VILASMEKQYHLRETMSFTKVTGRGIQLVV
jgi:hypothetical protein